MRQLILSIPTQGDRSGIAAFRRRCGHMHRPAPPITATGPASLLAETGCEARSRSLHNSHWPAGIACFIALLGCSDQADNASEPPPSRSHEPLAIEITGREYEWYVRYPGPDGIFGTHDDRHTVRHPHAPQHTRLRILLKSEDYLYSFAVPERDLKEIAVPDLSFELALSTGGAGNLEFRGDQFCGFTHPQLSGNIVVQSSSDFAAWLASLPAHP